jgi:prophage antirepressor-like protein
MNAEKVESVKQCEPPVLRAFASEEFGSIRSIMIDSDPWFVGKDVAAALGYGDTDQALRKHVDTEDRLTRRFNGSGQNRLMTVINESGLYALIFGSKLDSAKRFKRWVTSEVLPAIRKTGSYTVKTTGQQRFELMNQEVLAVQKIQNEMMAKLDAFETARKQDRQAIDNVLFVCKQLERKLQSTQPGSYTPRQTPKGRSEWRTEVYDLANKIVSLTGLTLNCVLHQGYDYLGRNYGWFFEDARKEFVRQTDYKGSLKNISGLDVIEASEMYKSIFMSIMKDRCENEKHNAEVKKGIKGVLTKTPPIIPADAIPKRRAAEPEPVVEAECRVVESEEPVSIVAESKKKKYYKASITLPIIKPIAEKRGDKTVGYWVTYQKIYDIVGVAKMNRLTKAYVRAHNRPPKSKTDIFAESEKNMKIFKEAAKALDAVS